MYIYIHTFGKFFFKESETPVFGSFWWFFQHFSKMLSFRVKRKTKMDSSPLKTPKTMPFGAVGPPPPLGAIYAPTMSPSTHPPTILQKS